MRRLMLPWGLLVLAIASTVGASILFRNKLTVSAATLGHGAIDAARSTFDVQAEDAPVARVIDLHSIAGRSAAEVRAALGAPSSQRSVVIRGVRLPAFFYRRSDGSQLEIVFAASRAEWITL
ncbi:MAG: hypothetical protein M3154_12170, partial [Candidatus Eremiobacteraeota bacterium]|nr:hypothetical protein [Candidatus Eremiobacteraeota bacterium]